MAVNVHTQTVGSPSTQNRMETPFLVQPRAAALVFPLDGSQSNTNFSLENRLVSNQVCLRVRVRASVWPLVGHNRVGFSQKVRHLINFGFTCFARCMVRAEHPRPLVGLRELIFPERCGAQCLSCVGPLTNGGGWFCSDSLGFTQSINGVVHAVSFSCGLGQTSVGRRALKRAPLILVRIHVLLKQLHVVINPA